MIVTNGKVGLMSTVINNEANYCSKVIYKKLSKNIPQEQNAFDRN